MSAEVCEEITIFVERRVRDRRRVECNRDEIICRRSVPDRRRNPHSYQGHWLRDADEPQPAGDRRRRSR